MGNRIRKAGGFLAMLVALCLFLGACASGQSVKPAAQGVEFHGQLAVREGKLTDANGDPFQLRGMSTHGIAWYPEYINAGSFGEVKKAGGNVIRVAMYTDTENGYLAEPETNLKLVCQAIENAKALDMYVLVDWHILSDGDPNANLDAAITFFDAVASRYPGDPAVLYEICNEPNGVSWSEICRYAYAIFPVIRQYSPDAVIVLGTPLYSQDLTSVDQEIFTEENFLYAYHFYAGQHESYKGLEKALEQGKPVMVSEWGVNLNWRNEPAMEEAEEFVRYLNKKGVSWCAWSLCNKDEIFSVLKSDCTALSGWQSEDLTAVGALIFEALRGGK